MTTNNQQPEVREEEVQEVASPEEQFDLVAEEATSEEVVNEALDEYGLEEVFRLQETEGDDEELTDEQINELLAVQDDFLESQAELNDSMVMGATHLSKIECLEKQIEVIEKQANPEYTYEQFEEEYKKYNGLVSYYFNEEKKDEADNLMKDVINVEVLKERVELLKKAYNLDLLQEVKLKKGLPIDDKMIKSTTRKITKALEKLYMDKPEEVKGYYMYMNTSVLALHELPTILTSSLDWSLGSARLFTYSLAKYICEKLPKEEGFITYAGEVIALLKGLVEVHPAFEEQNQHITEILTAYHQTLV